MMPPQFIVLANDPTINNLLPLTAIPPAKEEEKFAPALTAHWQTPVGSNLATKTSLNPVANKLYGPKFFVPTKSPITYMFPDASLARSTFPS
ncbi:MAG: hypothetical protein BWY67_01173 [Bacteroidetes bacterium ADurb.Bin397]|nr:MAG: hypothetical protein BWY67_01173 [Bacteroidetes bacterium ADurb.Bin397]